MSSKNPAISQNAKNLLILLDLLTSLSKMPQ